MGEAILFAVVASSALPLGALIGVVSPPRRAVTAAGGRRCRRPGAARRGDARRRAGEPGEVVLIWTATAVLLALAVVVGYAALEGVDDETLSWPLGFAAGAVLASLADTLMPEAFGEGGPPVAYATALGFLASFLISAA